MFNIFASLFSSPKKSSYMTYEEARMRAYAIMGHEDITLEWIDNEGIESNGIGWYAWDNGHMELGPKFIGR
jgi:hypothetical protein